MQRNRGKQKNGKTSNLFKETGNRKGTFHARIGVIKDINGKYLTEGKENKRWQEYTEELYKKGLNDPDNQSHRVRHN